MGCVCHDRCVLGRAMLRVELSAPQWRGQTDRKDLQEFYCRVGQGVISGMEAAVATPLGQVSFWSLVFVPSVSH